MKNCKTKPKYKISIHEYTLNIHEYTYIYMIKISKCTNKLGRRDKFSLQKNSI